MDSGADYPIFPAELARDLKLDLTHAPVWIFSGTTGMRQVARVAELSLTVLMENDEDHAFEVKTACAFCDTFKFAGVLLGQNGFFSRFKTTFHQPKAYFEVEPWDDSTIP